jgi:hypothetical protein
MKAVFFSSQRGFYEDEVPDWARFAFEDFDGSWDELLRRLNWKHRWMIGVHEKYSIEASAHTKDGKAIVDISDHSYCETVLVEDAASLLALRIQLMSAVNTEISAFLAKTWFAISKIVLSNSASRA